MPPRTSCSMSAFARATCGRSRKPEIFRHCRPPRSKARLNADLKRNYYIDNNVGGGPDADRDPAHRLRGHGRAGAVCAADLRLELRLCAGAGRAGVWCCSGLAIWFMRRETGANRASRRGGRRAGQGGADVPDFAFSGGTREGCATPPPRSRPWASGCAGRSSRRTEMLAGGQPRSAHAAHPHEAVAGAPARIARDQGAGATNVGRHGAHDRRLPRLRPAARATRIRCRSTSPRSWKTWRPAPGATMPNVEVGWAGATWTSELRARSPSSAA